MVTMSSKNQDQYHSSAPRRLLDGRAFLILLAILAVAIFSAVAGFVEVLNIADAVYLAFVAVSVAGVLLAALGSARDALLGVLPPAPAIRFAFPCLAGRLITRPGDHFRPPLSFS